MQLGYLVPEFPGQTHAFFWREILELERRGARVDVISTRPPPRGVMSHAWTRNAQGRTAYLARPAPLDAVAAAALLSLAVLRGRVHRIAEDLPGETRRRIAAVLVAGALLAGRARRAGWRHVHVHSAGDAALAALAAARLSPGLSYSITLHGPLGDYGGHQASKWGGAAFALVITEVLREELARALGEDLPGRTAIAPMGIDADQWERLAPRRERRADEPVRIFTCGRLNPAKGHDTLLRAVALLRDRGLQIRLVVAGEDDDGGSGYRVELESLIGSLALSEQVRLLGAVDETVIRRELERAHLFVLASRAEPLGVAIMEAMAAGVPVIVGDGGGVRELLGDPPTGTLFPPGNAPALAAAITGLLDDSSHARAMADHARSRVIASFSTRSSARTLLRLATSGAVVAQPAGAS